MKGSAGTPSQEKMRNYQKSQNLSRTSKVWFLVFKLKTGEKGDCEKIETKCPFYKTRLQCYQSLLNFLKGIGRKITDLNHVDHNAWETKDEGVSKIRIEISWSKVI